MAQKKETEISIDRIKTGVLSFCILGRTPIILNRMSQKAMHELLLPKGRKNAASRAGTLKHDPLAEFRAAPYTAGGETSPTLLQQVASAFKGAIRSAALDIPGSSKKQIGRLTWVQGERVGIYGVPQIFMAVTRSADINRTPDIRTRCIVPEWACRLSVEFAQPALNEKAVANLLAGAGVIAGIGDWRNEKGAGTYGQFEIVNADNPEFLRIIETGGYAAQKAAMDAPRAYDDETEEMLEWFGQETARRGIRAVSR